MLHSRLLALLQAPPFSAPAPILRGISNLRLPHLAIVCIAKLLSILDHLRVDQPISVPSTPSFIFTSPLLSSRTPSVVPTATPTVLSEIVPHSLPFTSPYGLLRPTSPTSPPGSVRLHRCSQLLYMKAQIHLSTHRSCGQVLPLSHHRKSVVSAPYLNLRLHSRPPLHNRCCHHHHRHLYSVSSTVSVSLTPSPVVPLPTPTPSLSSQAVSLATSSGTPTLLPTVQLSAVSLTRSPSTVSTASMRSSVLDSRSVFEEPLYEDIPQSRLSCRLVRSLTVRSVSLFSRNCYCLFFKRAE